MNIEIKRTFPQKDSIELDGLPDGWKIVNLSQISELIMGQSPPGSTYNTRGEGVPFFQGKVDFTEKSPVVRIWCTQPKKLAKSGDILISVRAPVGPTNVADRDCSIGRGLAAIRPQYGVPVEYILYYLKLKEPELVLSGTGSTFSAIKKEDLANLSIPLPPLSEQHRIVARVEALLSQINAARDRLNRVPLVMKRFRQAVLAAACSGRLTEGWREEHPVVEPAAILLENIIKKRGATKIEHLKKIQPITYELNDLPENWIWTQIGFITESMKNGIYKESKYYIDDGFPCLRMYNIEDGKIIWKNIKHMDLSDNEIKAYLLKKDDILINRVNSRELVGKSALITERMEPCVYESKNIRLRMFNEEINSQYVVYWLQVNAQKFFNLNAQQTVGMASINQDQIASMPIPLPPLSEQHEIVRGVNALFALADQIEHQVVDATKRTEALTQAVLVKAFRGELVEESGS
ncbi:MAG: restriction endonuclease subunit S [Methanomicrobiales archaeon]